MRPVILLSAILLAAGLAVLAGCDDDSGPESFAVTINVVDEQGDPVPGLQVGLAPETSFYMDGKAAAVVPGDLPPVQYELKPAYPNPFYPATSLEFTVPQEAYIRMTIENIEGETIRTLLGDDILPAGRHQMIWDGRISVDEVACSGVYYARFQARLVNPGEPVADQRRPMLLARLDDGDTGIGTTDDNGRLVLTDRTLFPSLYDIDPITAYDENGEAVGTIDITSDMRFLLSEEGTSNRMRFNRDVNGSEEFTFTWSVR